MPLLRYELRVRGVPRVAWDKTKPDANINLFLRVVNYHFEIKDSGPEKDADYTDARPLSTIVDAGDEPQGGGRSGGGRTFVGRAFPMVAPWAGTV